jgi:hypothetical protein
MTSGQFKGTLLEYIVRRLLQNCGFTSVVPDGHYIFAQAGNELFFINGKGAAHDADTLMDPPIQMPFSYPSRLLFECKSYQISIGLNVIRNALGLRYDINEFEIVTDETIERRKNRHRETYAIANRKRYNYLVGVAAVQDFTKDAFEFAGNNKIPLLSLRWFLPHHVCELFHDINDRYLNDINFDLRNLIYTFFKDKSSDTYYNPDYLLVQRFIEQDNVVGQIIRSFNELINQSFVGLLESGDIIFLFADSTRAYLTIRQLDSFQNIQGRLHFDEETPDIWTLALRTGDTRSTFSFHVPHRIMLQWGEFNLDKIEAPNLKETYFSRIFIYTGRLHGSLPFLLVNLDLEWLGGVRERNRRRG